MSVACSGFLIRRLLGDCIVLVENYLVKVAFEKTNLKILFLFYNEMYLFYNEPFLNLNVAFFKTTFSFFLIVLQFCISKTRQ